MDVFLFRSNKRSNYRKNTNSYLNNKPRTKGNIRQMYEKYFKLAKEESSSGDKIQSEYYYQFADHYTRLINELGLKSFDNVNSVKFISEKKIQSEEIQSAEIQSEEIQSEEIQSEEIQSEDKINESNEKNIILDESENNLEESSESIEKVSFIAKPARKKTIKSKKEVS